MRVKCGMAELMNRKKSCICIHLSICGYISVHSLRVMLSACYQLISISISGITEIWILVYLVMISKLTFPMKNWIISTVCHGGKSTTKLIYRTDMIIRRIMLLHLWTTLLSDCQSMRLFDIGLFMLKIQLHSIPEITIIMLRPIRHRIWFHRARKHRLLKHQFGILMSRQRKNFDIKARKLRLTFFSIKVITVVLRCYHQIILLMQIVIDFFSLY